MNDLIIANEPSETAQNAPNSDFISRKAAIEHLKKRLYETALNNNTEHPYYEEMADNRVDIWMNEVPSAQQERDIPLKPIETRDTAWGIPKRQAVCPKCDYYLGHIAFLDVYKGKRITYCETCGQAIDWEGWDFDE